MTFIDDISSSLAAVQSKIASFSTGALPSDLGDGFAAVLASVTSATTDPAAVLGAGAGTGAGSGNGTSTVAGTSMSTLAGLGSGSGAVTGSAVVADASRYLGVPYKWGGTDPSVGLDCSGLVQLTYKDLGISLPRGAAAQAQMGTSVPSLAQAQPGDLVAFGTPVEHIGIYAGNGMMVVAPHTGAQVRYEKISVTPSAIRRIVPSDSSVDVSGLASTMGFDPTAGTSGPASGPYADLFNAAGTKYGIDPRILSAVAHAESNYTPTAASGAGAQGLMQLMPGTAASLGVNALDPTQAVDGAARMLSGLLQRFGNLPEALAAYNAGSGAVARYGGIPPYPETRAYVSRVLGYISQEGA